MGSKIPLYKQQVYTSSTIKCNFLPIELLISIKITPYFNSYHQVDMSFESLNWKIDSPMVEFRNMKGGTKTDATFISSNYFRKDAYMDVMGLSTTHPLYTLYKLSQKLDTNYITNDELAEHTLQSFSTIETMLLNLSNKGFIN